MEILGIFIVFIICVIFLALTINTTNEFIKDIFNLGYKLGYDDGCIDTEDKKNRSYK